MDITQDYLRSILYYNPQFGIFVWREDRPRAKAGEIATKAHRGYERIFLKGAYYFAHRLAWLYTYGDWPTDMIDHINQKKGDNRIGNLRDVSNTENQRNRKGKDLGIAWIERSESWQVTIGSKYIGIFKDKEDAINARKAAEVQYGYHENHSGE